MKLCALGSLINLAFGSGFFLGGGEESVGLGCFGLGFLIFF